MEIEELRAGVWAFRGGVNLGAIVKDNFVIFLDAGLDDGPARKLWRWAEDRNLRPFAAILTHAHADHFGGAHLWASRGLPLFSSPLEGAMMEQPLLEPLFLFSGAAPLPELRSKFTLAKPCRLNGDLNPGAVEFGPIELEVVALPGHSPAQIGVRAGDVLFCADALFPPEILEKHPIPFCHDFPQALISLQVVEEAELVVPGHGPILRGEAVRTACHAFRHQLTRIREISLREIKTPQTAEEILVRMAEELGTTFGNATQFLLARTTVFAALSSLVQEGLAEAIVEGNRLVWRRR